MVPLLASIQDDEKLTEIFKVLKPETVYHAAAGKHVPLVERNLVEGIKNNVFEPKSSRNGNKIQCWLPCLVSTGQSSAADQPNGSDKIIAEDDPANYVV